MKPFNLVIDRSYGFVRGALTILLGIAFIIWPDKAKEYTCLILGVIVIVLGLSALIRSNFGKEGNVLNLLAINGFLDIIFGVLLLIFRDFFVNLITFLFGFMLLVFGIASLVETVSARKNTGNIRKSAFIFPILITALGIGMFFMPDKSSNAVFVLFGISIVVYGIFEFVVFGKSRKMVTQETVEEVSYEEVENK
ncbi:MAG: DUF308 domain-containing protein [Alistipes sp.]|nr:DUF308 domain-containing protein [Candidatus Minthomonas equi]